MVSAEEPSRSRLDECFSWGAIKAPRQRSAPFFPEVHTSSQYYGTPPTRLASVLLLQLLSHPLTVPKKSTLPPLDESVASHLCPPTAIGWKAFRPSRAEPHLHLLDAPTGGWTSGFRASHRWLCSRSSRPRCSPMRKPVWIQPLSGTCGARQTLALSTAKATAQAIGHSMSSPYSVGAPLLAHDDGDERQSFPSLTLQ